MKEKELLRLQELKKIEEDIYSQGMEYICGIDEAGVNDSKKVSEKKREKLYDEIIENAISYSVGIVDQKEIDRVNILNATKAGLTESIRGLKVKPDIILVDALKGIDTCGIPYQSIIKGDAKCYSIAAASIIAKVTFEKHKGYGTAAHIAAIKEHGLCPLHRLSFVKNIIDKN